MRRRISTTPNFAASVAYRVSPECSVRQRDGRRPGYSLPATRPPMFQQSTRGLNRDAFPGQRRDRPAVPICEPDADAMHIGAQRRLVIGVRPHMRMPLEASIGMAGRERRISVRRSRSVREFMSAAAWKDTQGREDRTRAGLPSASPAADKASHNGNRLAIGNTPAGIKPGPHSPITEIPVPVSSRAGFQSRAGSRGDLCTYFPVRLGPLSATRAAPLSIRHGGAP